MHLSPVLALEQGSTFLMYSVASASFSLEPVFHKQSVLLYPSSQRKEHGSITITQQSQAAA